ncbi:MAG TPA: hypothetical protein VEA69_16650 [Tepidisphaeraceae bacterium]|nr:hypothetical protein [Tepidisphaeraceae bacterium]
MSRSDPIVVVLPSWNHQNLGGLRWVVGSFNRRLQWQSSQSFLTEADAKREAARLRRTLRRQERKPGT